MGEVEFENFEITDQDLEDEFNPDRRRPHLSKNQQIYGIWADEEHETRPSVSRSNYNHKGYSGINFVGGGIQQAGKQTGNDDKEESDEDAGDSPERSSNSSDEGYTPKSLPIRFGRRKLRGGKRFPGLSGHPGEEGDQFGGWERYTKGIGHTLLLQMGYQPGKGLGRDLQGIVNPIEAKQRKGRGAVGLYGSEHKKPPIIHVESDEDEQPSQLRKYQWKKKAEDGKKKQKFTFKTVDDVIAEGGSRKMLGDSSQLSKVKVIDLTGPEQRVLSGYHAIHQQHSKPREQDDDRTTKRFQHFALPELMHNLNLLLDLTEQEIIQNDRQHRHENDLVVNIEHEIEKLDRVIDNEHKQISATEEILSIIDELETKSQSDGEDSLTLQNAAAIFRKLQDDYYEDYKLLELSNLAVTFVFPLIKKHFENWNPLRESKFGVEIMKEWKDILENSNKQMYDSKDMDVYHRLVWDVWMPQVRQAVLEWNCRDCVPLIELLENWLPVIPPWVTENILTQLIFPRLQQEVENWNPLMDRMYIHVWIHPWLPLMGPRLETLYAPIRNKLANAMVNWHPSDDSARKILQPWVQVFPRGAMEAFVLKNILPKLALCMQEFVINPHQQHLEPWHWVMAWEDYLPVPSLVNLLAETFFPKWHHVLCSWLSHNPNYDEVSKWYTGWKSMFSDSLLNHPIIEEQFTNALDIMHRAVSLGYQPGMKDHISYLSSLGRQRENEASQMQNARNFEAIAQGIRTGGATASNITMTFKDLITRKAEEIGVLFMPIPNRFQEAKQVYRFGQIMLYIDRGVIFVQNPPVSGTSSWIPTSLQMLVDMAR